jgi:hypothetical protein
MEVVGIWWWYNHINTGRLLCLFKDMSDRLMFIIYDAVWNAQSLKKGSRWNIKIKIPRSQILWHFLWCHFVAYILIASGLSSVPPNQGFWIPYYAYVPDVRGGQTMPGWVCALDPFLTWHIGGHIRFFPCASAVCPLITFLNFYLPGFRQCGHTRFRIRHIQKPFERVTLPFLCGHTRTFSKFPRRDVNQMWRQSETNALSAP